MKNQFSLRQQRVSMLIQKILVEILQRSIVFAGEIDKSPISITKVEVSGDLQIANCYFIPFNTILTLDQIKDLLHKHRFNFRKLITQKINLKFSPEVRFYYDNSLSNVEMVEKILKDISKN